MELTIHAFERIMGRTSMLPEDVQAIVASGAVVRLGSDGEYEFNLFYSPHDRTTKIAMVVDCGRILVSIWESTYFLPEGVREVTPADKREARRVFTKFLFARLKDAHETPEMTVAIRVRVSENGYRRTKKIVHAEPLGEMPISSLRSSEAVIAACSPRLRELTGEMESSGKNWSRDRLRYTFLVQKSDDAYAELFSILHRTLRKQC